MNTGIFKQAESRHAAMEKKANSLQYSRSLIEAKETWSEFLTETNRCFNRLGNAMTEPPEQGWFANLTGLRRSDPLLKYLEAARNADEHGRDEIATLQPGLLEIGLGGGLVHIDRLVIGQNGGIEVLQGWQGRPGNPINMKQTPPVLQLEPVVNRGVTYAVPTTHLGQALAALTPVVAAQHALVFTMSKLAEAKSRFA